MSIEEKIYQDYVAAMKKREKEKAAFLSYIRAELKNAAKALKKDSLSDEEALGVIKKQKKRLDDSKESFIKSKRDDLLKNLEDEIAMLAEYLPEALSEPELTALIEEVVSSAGATSMKDMGRVMKEVLAKAGARADAKEASALVKKRLSPS